MREGLTLLIEKQADMKVIAEAEETSAVEKLIGALPVDVVVLIENVAASFGTRQISQLLRVRPEVGVIVLASNPSAPSIRSTLEAGASGCLTNECSSQELISAIRAASEKHMFLSPKLVHLVFTAQVRAPQRERQLKSLAPREREILRRIAEGQITKKIAADLGIGPKTVETHRRRIMTKLNVFTVAELTKHALRQGLTTLESSA